MRHALLALLAEGFTHGYELKQAFERLLGPVWPAINIGQIYTTLGRLERDSLVQSHDVAQTGRPNKRVYELTDQGRAALAEWMVAPIESTRLKNELFMKLVLASAANVDPLRLLERQRDKYLQALRDLDALSLESEADSAAQLLIEGAMLHLEADLKWLDRCEARLETGSGLPRSSDGPAEEENLSRPAGQALSTPEEDQT